MTAVLMIVAPQDFSDPEYFVPKKAFEEAGFEVATASVRAGPVQSNKGTIVTADRGIQMCDPKDYQAVLLVGGKGAREFFDDPALHRFLQEFHATGGLTTAICVSPTTLANAGLLQGKKATVWNESGLIENLEAKGAQYTGLSMTRDDTIATANSPEAAGELAEEILNYFKEKTYAQ